MDTLTHRFKRIVTATAVGVWFSLPAFAQQTMLDELYQELLQADEESQPRIEERIIAQWSKSGSPAMDLLLKRGQDALEEGAPDAAAEHFSALVDHAPDFAEGYYGRATSYYTLGLMGPAIDDLRKTLVLNPRHFEAMFALAYIMEEFERPDDAFDVYQLILDINPQSPEALDAVDRLQLQLKGQAI